jgi:hypothetical protein
LKNIQAEVKTSPFKTHGFNPRVLKTDKEEADLVRRHDKTVEEADAAADEGDKQRL